jgi:Fur family peroxide stress response transcriptional regulator
MSKYLKNSRQRNLILRIIRSTHRHPTADWIYKKARCEMPNISLGTVYRNLKLLCDEGRIRELTIGSGGKHFDGDMRDHYHLHCISCGCVEDVPHISSRAYSEEIQNLTGYEIHSHRLEFFGLCPNCKKLYC